LKILAIDTATRRGSVALLDGPTTLGAAWLDRDNGRALAPAVVQLLGRDGLGQVEGVALSIGPGSFTGLRIGLAFVKGLALARPLPTVAVSTLELIARAAGGPEVLAVIDARNGELFVRLDAAPPIPDGLYRTAELRALLDGRPSGVLAGEPPPELLASLEGYIAAPEPPEPRAITLGALALPRFLAGHGRDPANLQPSYVQPVAVDRPRHGVDTLASQT
jgi:tRNA threonylcarbamoyladenosine biosynthesis protein TsaB